MSPGFTMLDNDAVLDRLPEIDGNAVKVYLALARRANVEGVCWPSIKQLTKDIGLPRRTTQRGLYSILALGLVEADRHKGNVTHYRLTRAAGGATPEQSSAAGGATVAPQVALGSAAGGAGVAPLVAHGTIPKNNTHEQHPGTTPRRPAAAEVSIPAELVSEEFSKAWADWIAHRKEIHKPAGQKAQEAALRKLAKWGSTRALAALEYSIANGWQGIFEPSDNGAHNGRSRTAVGPGQRHPADRRDQPGSF
jgi:DNA-binding transcriptional ArsR family regulator